MQEIRPSLGAGKPQGLVGQQGQQAISGRPGNQGSHLDSVVDQSSSKRRANDKGFCVIISIGVTIASMVYYLVSLI